VDTPRERWEAAPRHAGPYLERHAETFAGDWVSEEHGGEYHVAFTGDLSAHRLALSELLPCAEVLHVHAARYAIAELLALQEQIADEVGALVAEGIHVCTMRPDRNEGVKVALVAQDARRATAALRQRYGAAVTVDYLGSERTVRKTVAWRCYIAQENDRRLVIHYATNTCFEFERVERTEDANEVRLTVVERAPVGFQTMAGGARTATVRLRSAVGDRRVVDGSTGLPRPACRSSR
jgi:hypothetical protein